jgi:hypothetical protein
VSIDGSEGTPRHRRLPHRGAQQLHDVRAEREGVGTLGLGRFGPQLQVGDRCVELQVTHEREQELLAVLGVEADELHAEQLQRPVRADEPDELLHGLSRFLSRWATK